MMTGSDGDALLIENCADVVRMDVFNRERQHRRLAEAHRLARHEPVSLRLQVEGAAPDDDFRIAFDPRPILGVDLPALARPKFLAIIASVIYHWTTGPLQPFPWLAAKLLIFAFLIFCGFMIRVTFPPFMVGWKTLVTTGPTPESDALTLVPPATYQAPAARIRLRRDDVAGSSG